MKVHDRRDEKAIFLDRIDHPVGKAAHHASPMFLGNSSPCLRLCEDSGDRSLRLVEEIKAQPCLCRVVIVQCLREIALSGREDLIIHGL